MMNARIRSLMILIAVVVAACGEGMTTPPPAVGVAINPPTVTVGAGDTQSFTATVSNATNTAVTWAASTGTIAGSGNTIMWTAPVAAGSATLTATSVEDGTKNSVSNVTVTSVAVAVTPADPDLFRGEETTFTATVTGTSTTDVTWTVTCGAGSPNGTTLAYTAPVAPGATCDVTATSNLDATATATEEIRVRSEWLVTSSNDATDGTCDWTHCSLREAINSANGIAGADVILLAPAAAVPALLAAQDPTFGPPLPPQRVTVVNPTAELPVITEDLSIFGEGATTTTLDLGASVSDMRRGFDIDGAIEVTLGGLTIQNGVADGFGGGIQVRGGAHLRALDVRIVNNQTNGGEGGGLALLGAGTQATLENTVIDNNRTLADPTIVRPGGGITLTAGTSLTMTGGSISNNVVDEGWGGAIRAIDFGTLMLDGVAVDNNSALDATSGFAGGIHTELAGEVSIVNSTISNNVAAVNGGGFRSTGSGTVAITSSTVSGNSAFQGAGAYFLDAQVTLQSTSFEDNDADNGPGAGGGGGFWAAGSTVVDATAVDILNNTATVHGGGLMTSETASVTLTNSTVDGNSADFAGGINLVGDAALTLTGTVISKNESRTASGAGVVSQANATVDASDTQFLDNTSAAAGGGLWLIGGAATLERVTVSGNTAVTNGGGMTASGTSTTISNSTFSGNTAGNAGGGIAGGAGVTVTNTTISGNTGRIGGGFGGFGPATLTNVTIAGNSGTDGGGAAFVFTAGVVTLANTVLAVNTGAAGPANCAISTGGGSFTSGDGNLADDATCGLTQPGDQESATAGLDATLADNGGTTLTHSLLAGSNAIDNSIAANCPTTDQRGAPRVGTCDVGAVEFGSVPPAN